MEGLSLQDLFRSPSQNPKNRASQAFNAERLTQYRASRQEQSAVTILTAEGDKVTITRGLSEQANGLTYDRFAKIQDGSLSVHADSSSYSKTSQFSFSVEGDLSEAELKDIKKALKLTDKLLPQIADGNIDVLSDGVEKLGKLDTLSSLDASYQFSQEIEVSEYTSLETAQQSQNGETPEDDHPASSVEQLLGDLKNKLTDLDPKQLKHVQRKLDHLLDRLLERNRGHRGPKLDGIFGKLKDHLFSSVEPPPVASGDEPTTPSAS